jgi:hypothetical protein
MGSKSNIAALVLRTNLLLFAVEQDELAKWRGTNILPDAAFEIAATYPVRIRDDRSIDLDMKSYIAALVGGDAD